MWSNGQTVTGNVDQEHFRSLCIYIGALRPVAHAGGVLTEAIAAIPGRRCAPSWRVASRGEAEDGYPARPCRSLPGRSRSRTSPRCWGRS